eukprot:CAMPEP_0206492762 /NCGR_PEP_ID=MMETSP0324_2-20121206/46374_1 /ASSEMBLY_ACC=CAM_ASM_000836 /TAXON_ID=2866 /ORGANISM="Crypthecodinium cohnii, Strain Seligo" /LENGTH=75 /DNA_ID=CAMNT_0053975385 /DNA_START=297 /DNA_END=524 /DNA_ORIENTATION=-
MVEFQASSSVLEGTSVEAEDMSESFRWENEDDEAEGVDEDEWDEESLQGLSLPCSEEAELDVVERSELQIAERLT